MGLSYKPLFKLLIEKNMKKTDLLNPPFSFSSPTLAKFAKGKTVNGEIILRLCRGLDCQPNDIMLYEKD